MKKRLLLTSVFIAVCTGIFAQSDMNQYIDKLMQKMTLQEKIGQLNLLPGNDITTGAVMKSPLGELTAKGELGAVLNVKGLDKIRALQEVAVKKSRLGIPLIFGQDVIHGDFVLRGMAHACGGNCGDGINACNVCKCRRP